MTPRSAFRAAGLAALLLAAFALPGWTQSSEGKKVALLVGVTAYDSDAFRNLKYPENDVEDLAAALSRPGTGFTSVRVLTATRGKKNKADLPTAANVRKALAELVAKRTKKDVVLVALAGHGMQ